MAGRRSKCAVRETCHGQRDQKEKKVLLQGSSGQQFHTGLGISLRPYGTRERAKATAEESSRSPGSQSTVDMTNM